MKGCGHNSLSVVSIKLKSQSSILSNFAETSTVNFAVCELTYTFEVTPQLGIDGISFNDDPDERLFTYSFDLDATYIQTYEIKAYTSVEQAPEVSEYVVWYLVVEYPCSYPDIITIGGITPETQIYALFTPSL